MNAERDELVQIGGLNRMSDVIPDQAVVAHVVRAAAWGNCTPEEAARQILEHLHPTIWPRRVPAYGTTGTRRIRKAAK